MQNFMNYEEEKMLPFNVHLSYSSDDILSVTVDLHIQWAKSNTNFEHLIVGNDKFYKCH